MGADIVVATTLSGNHDTSPFSLNGFAVDQGLTRSRTQNFEQTLQNSMHHFCAENQSC